MNPTLPTAVELEKLPLRALVAYALRTVNRLTSHLHGYIPDHLMANVIQLTESALDSDSINADDGTGILIAAEHIVGVCTTAESNESPRKALLVFSFVYLALTVINAGLAAEGSGDVRRNAKQAAEFANKTISTLSALTSVDQDLAIMAAQQDYQVLLRAYGEHNEVILADRVRCFD